MPLICDKDSTCGNHPPNGSSNPSGGWSNNVFVGGKNVIMVGTAYSPHEKEHNSPHLSGGSPTVFVNGQPIGRLGDPLDCGATTIVGNGSNVYAN